MAYPWWEIWGIMRWGDGLVPGVVYFSFWRDVIGGGGSKIMSQWRRFGKITLETPLYFVYQEKTGNAPFPVSALFRASAQWVCLHCVRETEIGLNSNFLYSITYWINVALILTTPSKCRIPICIIVSNYTSTLHQVMMIFYQCPFRLLLRISTKAVEYRASAHDEWSLFT